MTNGVIVKSAEPVVLDNDVNTALDNLVIDVVKFNVDTVEILHSRLHFHAGKHQDDFAVVNLAFTEKLARYHEEHGDVPIPSLIARQYLA